MRKPLEQELFDDPPPVMNRHERRKRRLKLEKGLDATLAERRCGECTACCTGLAIEELQKPCGVDCKHVGVNGCGIYDKRPKACRDFLCGWRIGAGTPEQRPDRTGVILCPVPGGHPAHPGATVHELWPGAFADAQDFLADVAQHLVLILIRDDLPRRVLGPEDRVRAMPAFIAEIRRLNDEERAQKELINARRGPFADRA